MIKQLSGKGKFFTIFRALICVLLYTSVIFGVMSCKIVESPQTCSVTPDGPLERNVSDEVIISLTPSHSWSSSQWNINITISNDSVLIPNGYRDTNTSITDFPAADSLGIFNIKMSPIDNTLELIFLCADVGESYITIDVFSEDSSIEDYIVDKKAIHVTVTEPVSQASRYFLYVLDNYRSVLRTFIMGSLTELEDSPHNNSNSYSNRTGLLSPNNQLLFTNTNPGGILSYSINQTTGVLSEIEHFDSGITNHLNIAPGSDYLYGGGFSGNFSIFSIDSANGELTSLYSYTPGSGVMSPAGTYDGNYLYVADRTNDVIYAYSVSDSDGSLTALSPPSYSTALDSAPTNIIIHPDNTFLYVYCYDSNQIKIFSINEANGALSEVTYSPVLIPSAIAYWAIHPDAGYLFASDNSSLLIYSINQVTGVLTDSGNSLDIGSTGIPISADRFRFRSMSSDGLYLFATATDSYGDTDPGNRVAIYEFNSENGVATQQTGSPYSVDSGNDYNTMGITSIVLPAL